MVKNFEPDGDAAKVLTENPKSGLTALLTGMGSLSYGELAGERMKLGLLLHDPKRSRIASPTIPTIRTTTTWSAS